jgi:hypothetical protein
MFSAVSTARPSMSLDGDDSDARLIFRSTNAASSWTYPGSSVVRIG